MWNADEIGARMNHHESEECIWNRQGPPPISVTSGNTQWTSVLECISAAGIYIRPLVVHQGTQPSQPYDHWFPPVPECPNFHWGFSKKGWVTNEYGAKWFEDIFLPETRREGGAPECYLSMLIRHIILAKCSI